ASRLSGTTCCGISHCRQPNLPAPPGTPWRCAAPRKEPNAMITKRALICQTRVPEAEQDRGSGRILELIEFLQSDGWAVTFIAQQAGASRRAIRRLQQRGVAAYAGFDSETEAIIAAGQFQVAVLAFWHVA